MKRRRPTPLLLSSLLAAVFAAALPAAAPALQQAGAAAPRRLGIYVFISSQGDVQTALAPGELRDQVERRLAAGTGGGPAAVPGTAELRPLVARHRVRTSMLANAAFFADLAAEAGLDTVALVDLIVLPSNLMLAVREVAVPSGLLLGIRVAELDLAQADLAAADLPAADRWRDALVQLCEGIDLARADGVMPPAGAAGRPVAILPVQPFGTDAVAARVAGFMLLRSALASGAVTAPDPSLVVTTLQEAGLEAHQLTAEGRALLAARFSCRLVIHPMVLSYAPEGRGVQDEVPGIDDLGQENVLLASGVLTLWAVDLANGEIESGAETYFELRRETGWFGIPDKRSPVTQLDAAIGGLWSTFVARQEEF